MQYGVLILSFNRDAKLLGREKGEDGMPVRKSVNRQYIGKNIQNFMELPNLIDIQLASYEKFLRRGTHQSGNTSEEVGLEDVFRTTFPIESPNGDMTLEYQSYTLDENDIKFSEYECKQKGLTYAIPLKAQIDLVFNQTCCRISDTPFSGRYLFSR